MINIKTPQETFELRNTLAELTVKEFEHVSAVLNEEQTNTIDKWSEVFTYLGLPQEVVDTLDLDDFLNILKEFNITKEMSADIVKSFEIEGQTYTAYDEKFKITVKEMGLIEAACKHNPKRYVGDVLAVLYKNLELDKELHTDKAHVKHKAELFRKHLTADIAVPVMNYLGKRFINNFELIASSNE